MRLKDIAEQDLSERDDYKSYYGGPFSTPVLGGVCKTISSDRIVEEEYRFIDKTRYSFKIDGQSIPFAAVRKTPRRVNLFRRGYNVKLAILPCMLPIAIDSLIEHIQTYGGISRKDNAVLEELLNTYQSMQKERIEKVRFNHFIKRIDHYLFRMEQRIKFKEQCKKFRKDYKEMSSNYKQSILFSFVKKKQKPL